MVFPNATPAILYPIRSRQGRIKKVTEWLTNLPSSGFKGEIFLHNTKRPSPTHLVRAIAVKNNVSWHPQIVSRERIYYPDSLGTKSIKKKRLMKKKIMKKRK